MIDSASSDELQCLKPTELGSRTLHIYFVNTRLVTNYKSFQLLDSLKTNSQVTSPNL